MSVHIITPIVWGTDGSAIQVQPAPLITNRAPSTSDTGPIGAVWVNSATNGIYVLARTHGTNTWVSSPGSGVGTFTDVTVSPGDLIVDGDTQVETFTANDVANFATDVNFLSGTITINADLDLSSAQAIELGSSADVAKALYLLANGGTSATIELENTAGTSVAAIALTATAGGITLTSGDTSADSFNIASSGGIDVDGAGLISIVSSRNNAQAILINSSAGGMDLTAVGTAGEDIDITATGSSVNISATEAAADAITIHASDAAGGVKIRAGSNGIEIGNDADCAIIDLGDVAATASRTITIGGGTNVTAAVTDLVEIAPDGATTNADSIKRTDICAGNVTTGQSLVNINSGTAASGTSTVNISTGTGGGTKVVNFGNADGLTTVNIDAITLINDSINVNTSINTGTSTGAVAIGNALAGAMTIDTAAGISLDGAAASNFSVSGAGIDLTLASAAGRVVVNGEEAAADAVRVLSAAGGLDANVALQMNLDSSQAAADAIRIVASDAAGGIDIDCGTAGAALDSTGAVSLQGAAASDFSVSGAGIDLTLASAAGRVVASAGEAAADAIRIVASDAAGGIDIDSGTAGTAIDSTGAISLQAAAASDFSVSGAGIDLTLASAAGRVVVNGEEAAADAVRILSAAGGLDVNTALAIDIASSGGNVAMSTASGTLLLDCTGVLELNSSGGVIGIGNDAVNQNINVGTGAAARTITIGNNSGATSVAVDCGTGGASFGATATAHTTTIGSTTTTSTTTIQSGTGGVIINSDGITSADTVDNTIASPTASTTINAYMGSATFTGFTTAAAGTQDFTITNNLVDTSSPILCTVCNEGANDAQIEIRRITRAAGSFVVKVVNSGAAALNGNVIITFWVMN